MAERHDGWTGARRRTFLDVLANTANVTAACAAVGKYKSGAYALKKRDAEFAAAWDDAIAIAIGALLTPLAASGAATWDGDSVDVELVGDMWLESRADLSVLAGANMALVGDELVQFGTAAAIAPRRFRLSRLLRGRRGSASAAHAAGARFAILDPAALFSLDLPSEAVGSDLKVRLAAPNVAFADAPTATLRIAGEAMRPLPPVHLSARAMPNGDVEIGWVRRSRAGFGWIDGADSPLAEAAEAFRLRCSVGAASIETEVGTTRHNLAAAEQIAAFGALPSAMTIAVSQLSGVVGAGRPASRTFTFNR